MRAAFGIPVVFVLAGAWVAGCSRTAPEVSFVAASTAVTVGSPVVFTDTSDTGGEAITSWMWDFGDGGTSTVSDPSHVYTTVGTYTVSLTISTSGEDYSVTRSGYIVVGPATPRVATWPAASGITYGQAIRESVLAGGEVSVEGTFAFETPDAVPNAGDYVAVVVFVPADGVNYEGVSGTVTVAVGKALPVVTAWPAAGTVIRGQPLGSSALSGGAASVAGVFVFDTPEVVLDAGTSVQALVFTPVDAENYVSVFGTASVTVTAVWFVKSGGSGDGSGWDSAIGSVQGAVDGLAGAGGGEVWVAGGIYTSGMNAVKASAGVYCVVAMAEHVHVYGGFSGTEMTREARDWAAHVTIIDGEGAHTCVTGADNATLDGFTIQHGWASTEDGGGGGMYNHACSPVVSHCTFSENVADIPAAYSLSGGGGMYNVSSSPVVTHCTFSGNTAYGGICGQGGGIHNYASSPVFSDCLVTGNKAYCGGGGMCNRVSSPVITGCVFAGNRASQAGGGMQNFLGSPTVSGCTFRDNEVAYSDVYSDGCGGGMCNEHSSPAITGCTFSGNRAPFCGGGIYGWWSSPAIAGCVFRENAASGSPYRTVAYGGGMYHVYSSEPFVSGCTFSRNSALSLGGGAYNSDSTPVFDNCLFMENEAVLGGCGLANYAASAAVTNCTFTGHTSPYGGGIYNAYSSTTTVVNCILWDNPTASIYGEIYDFSSSVSAVTYSCVRGGYEGAGNLSADPLLIGTAGGAGRIRPLSPCIDAGTVSGAPGVDVRDVARPQGGGVDMGAYELDDSDGDGISDAWEQAHFGSLAAATDRSDADGDGVSDAEESLYGSDPAVSDSDGDGLSERDELAHGWDPVVATAVRRVRAGNASGVEDGLAWPSAFTSIQAAIDAVKAVGEGEVWVAAGTYAAASSTDSYVAQMHRRVSLYGGFAGSETERGARSWEANPTLLDGEGVRGVVCGANDTVFDGFVVQHGSATLGGGMYNSGVSPVVSHCTFSGNNGTFGGGMCNMYAASPVVSGGVFEGNTARSGGGVYNAYYSSPVLVNCTFESNTALAGGGMYDTDSSSPVVSNGAFTGNRATSNGGGILNTTMSSPVLSDCVFTGNSAVSGGGVYDVKCSSSVVSNGTFTGNSATSGGGMYVWDVSSPVISNSVFRGNSATSGGGIFAGYQCSPSLQDCVFSGNTSTERGAGAYNRDATPVFNACVFSQNVSDGTGGGMHNLRSSSVVVQCTFDRNTAVNGGGGMYGDDSAPGVIRCTFSANTTESSGGGMYNDDWDSRPAVFACTFSGNTAATSGGGMCNNSSSSPVVTGCLFTGNTASYGGGMLNCARACPTVFGCRFTGNTALMTGGGMGNDIDASSIVIDSVFAGNVADTGGGMANNVSSPTVANCTFAANTAASSGGALSNTLASLPVIVNSILWGDSAAAVSNEVCCDADSVPVLTYSCVAGGYAGMGTISGDPLFVDAVNGDFGLQSGSPCIDTGTADGAPGTDIAGAARPRGGGYDMGAYEYSGS